MIYSGNKLLNWNSIFMLVIVPIIFFVSPAPKNREVLFYGIMIPLMYLLFVSQAFYFILTQDTLIIKNYGFPFLKIQYLIADIQKIGVYNSRRSFSKAILQIKTNKSKSFGYQGASLKIKDWQSLIKDFEQKNIEVTVDVYYLKSK